MLGVGSSAAFQGAECWEWGESDCKEGSAQLLSSAGLLWVLPAYICKSHM